MTTNEQTLYVMTSPEGAAYLAQDADETGRWRWLDADGEDTETSGATIPEAIAAAEAAWPEGRVGGYQLRECKAEDITAGDLADEVRDHPYAKHETYRVLPVDGAYVQEGAERGQMIWSPVTQTFGIAWGSDADWAFAESPAEALRRWATDRMVN